MKPTKRERILALGISLVPWAGALFFISVDIPYALNHEGFHLAGMVQFPAAFGFLAMFFGLAATVGFLTSEIEDRILLAGVSLVGSTACFGFLTIRSMM